jgi:hypothetical protein
MHSTPTLRCGPRIHATTRRPTPILVRTACMCQYIIFISPSKHWQPLYFYMWRESLPAAFFPVLATPSVQFTLQLHPRSNQEPFGHFLQGRERPGRQEMHGVLVTCGEQ